VRCRRRSGRGAPATKDTSMTNATETATLDPQDSRRERKKRETRERIRAAAVQLVDAQGIHNTTVEAICEAADVSARTFFNYFPSKNAAILGLPTMAITEDARTAFLAGAGGLLDDITLLIAGFSDAMPTKDKNKHGLIQRHPELASTLFEWGNAQRGDLIALVVQRTDADTARLAVGAVMLAFSDAASRGVDLGPDTILAEVHSSLDRLTALIDGRQQH
jgi:AcrR family transcriptional regulator